MYTSYMAKRFEHFVRSGCSYTGCAISGCCWFNSFYSKKCLSQSSVIPFELIKISSLILMSKKWWWGQTVLVLDNFRFCTSFLFFSCQCYFCVRPELLTLVWWWSFNNGQALSTNQSPIKEFSIDISSNIRQVILSKGQIDCNICMYNKHEYSHK